MSTNAKVAELFRIAAAVMELKGESVFKSIAFSRVSRIVDNLSTDVRELVEGDTLKDVSGIGASSRKIIEDVVKTGNSADVDELRASVPAGLIDMLDIPSLGPKTVARLWKERGITDEAMLAAALDDGSLEGMEGLGTKKLESIRAGLKIRASSGGRLGIAIAAPLAARLRDAVAAMPGVSDVRIGGSLRRRRETIGDIDLIATLDASADAEAITTAFTKLPGVTAVLGQGTRTSVMIEPGIQSDLRICPAESFGATLLYFTGSKDHNVLVRSLAQDRGLTLNEWGLYEEKEWAKVKRKPSDIPTLPSRAGRSEQEIYAALGLAMIPPELREGRDEVDRAKKGELPLLLDLADLRGDLHSHTTASDGAATIAQMATAAAALGYEYLAVTDHSKSSAIANGLDPKRLLAHAAMVRKVSDQIRGITLLAGSEVDILADGRLDYEDAVLAELDWVVASPHSSLKQDSKKATDRILRAIDNRYVNVIGHPTGRLIGMREGLPLDFGRVFKAAAGNGTALEINAGWPRLDLSDLNARAAIEAGVILTIDTDAHSLEGLGGMMLGVGVARRAGTTAANVLNAQKLAAVRAFVKKKR